MIVSPDFHTKKAEILRLIAGHFPQLQIQIIKNLTYEEYKKVISRAKWAITFGGLDGYFIDDNSDDGTANVCISSGNGKVRLIRHKENRGVGAAVVTGYKEAIKEEHG